MGYGYDVFKRNTGKDSMLPRDKEIVLIRGEHPVIDHTFRTEKSPEFLEAKALGPCTYEDYHPELSEAEKPQNVQILSESEAAQVMADTSIEIMKASLSQLRNIRVSKKKAVEELVLSNADLLAYLAANKTLAPGASQEQSISNENAETVDQLCFLSGLVERSVIKDEELFPFLGSSWPHKLNNKLL